MIPQHFLHFVFNSSLLSVKLISLCVHLSSKLRFRSGRSWKASDEDALFLRSDRGSERAKGRDRSRWNPDRVFQERIAVPWSLYFFSPRRSTSHPFLWHRSAHFLKVIRDRYSVADKSILWDRPKKYLVKDTEIRDWWDKKWVCQIIIVREGLLPRSEVTITTKRHEGLPSPMQSIFV